MFLNLTHWMNTNKTLRKTVRTKRRRAKNEKERSVLEKVIANAEMDVPEVMIENKLEQMLQDFEMRMRYQGLPLEQYLQFTNQTLDSLKDNFRSDAEFQVKLGLVLEQIVKAENIEATEEELEE